MPGVKSTWAFRREPHGQGGSFEWRELEAVDGSEPGPKEVIAVDFPSNDKVFRRWQSRIHGELPSRQSRRAAGRVEKGKSRD